MSDASDMLAAALEQMDGIIAGNLRPLRDGIGPFILLPWLFSYNCPLTFPLSYFHLLAFSDTFRLPLVLLLTLFSIFFQNIYFRFSPGDMPVDF